MAYGWFPSLRLSLYSHFQCPFAHVTYAMHIINIFHIVNLTLRTVTSIHNIQKMDQK